MPWHRFRICEKAALLHKINPADDADSYEIVRLLPAAAGEFRYVVKSTIDSHESVAGESELRKMKCPANSKM